MTHEHLQRARALDRPTREAMLRREPAVQDFWIGHRHLLLDAWAEWEQAEVGLGVLDDTLIDAELRTAVANAWNHPATESAVRDLIQEPAPGVFAFRFFDPDQIRVLRDYLERAWDADIPLRPPYGIVLNRRGAMLDPRSAGCLGGPRFQAFYRLLHDTYMRPISRLLFPEVQGADTQTFGFSINYQPETDTSIRPHSDASAVTLNINVNLPDEDFTGSEVDFLDAATGDVTSLTFAPGTAMIHRGHVPHTAKPITSGSRTNLVLWLFGEGGRVPGPVAAPATTDPHTRWTVPESIPDDYVPF